MEVTSLEIEGLQIVNLDKFKEDRGSFMEIYHDGLSGKEKKAFFDP